MAQYAEIIAHSCCSVHVPGVAWPPWTEPIKRSPALSARGYRRTQKNILEFLSAGGMHSSETISREIDEKINTVQYWMPALVKKGALDVTPSKNERGRPIKLYAIKAK